MHTALLRCLVLLHTILLLTACSMDGYEDRYEVSDEEVLSDEFEGLRAETWRERGVLRDLDDEADRLGFEEIRRKLRTADVEWYVNAFLVARGILDP